VNAETGGGLTAEERFWAAAQRHGLIPVTAPWQFLPARDKDALRKALDEYDAARLADRDAALARAWDQGAEATAEWTANNPGPSGVPHDPPSNPYEAGS
jgi:hypothetical protein